MTKYGATGWPGVAYIEAWGTPSNEEQFLKLHDMIIGSTNVSGFLADLSILAASTLSETANSHIECGVTLRQRKRSATVAGSSARATALDKLEQVLGHGPCLTSLEAMKPVILDDVERDTRWPEDQKLLAESDCRSVLGVPLALDETQAAALDFFADEPAVFTAHVVRRAEAFAELAGRALRLALKIADAQNLAEDLTAALEHRTVINLACGVVMAQNRCTQEEAMAVLTQASSHRNQKLRDVAADILHQVGSGSVSTYFEP